METTSRETIVELLSGLVDSVPGRLAAEERGEVTMAQMTKSSMKKQLKWVRKKANAKAFRKERRKREGIKQRERKELIGEDEYKAQERAAAQKLKDGDARIIEALKGDAGTCPPAMRVAIDLSFKDNTSQEFNSLMKQLNYTYAAMRRCSIPVSLYLCSYAGAAKDQCSKFNVDRWNIGRLAPHVSEAFDKSSLVYLSPDSEHVLEEVTPDKVYVIGGIVDRSKKTGMTKNAAAKVGITTARLPLPSKVRDRVLNIDTAIIMLMRRAEGKDWAEVVEGVVPMRKMLPHGTPSRRRPLKKAKLETEVAAAAPVVATVATVAAATEEANPLDSTASGAPSGEEPKTAGAEAGAEATETRFA